MNHFLKGAFLLVCFISSQVCAQTLIGKVKNNENGENLLGVQIYVPELKKGTISDFKGEFKLEELPIGQFQVQFSYIGFEKYIKNVTIINGELKIEVLLKESILESQEVIVSVASHNHPERTPIKIEQINHEQLISNGAPNLTDALSNLPGIDNQSTGPSTSKPVIRGLSSNRILIYTEGLKLQNQQWGDDHSLGINEMGIDRIEIIKGPASLLYGSDALGGVLNFINEKPAKVGYTEGDYVLKLFSNSIGLQTNAGIKKSTKSWRYGLRIGHQNHADYLTGDQFRVPNSRFNENGLKTNLGYLNRKFNYTINYNYSQRTSGIIEPSLEPIEGNLRNIDIPFQQSETHIVANQMSFFFKEAKLKVNWGIISNNRKEFEEEHGHEEEHEEEEHEEEEHEEHLNNEIIDPALNMQLNTYNLDLKYHLPKINDQLNIILGAQSTIENNSNYGEEVIIPDAITRKIGVFGLTELELSTKNHIQIGARVDEQNINARTTEHITSFNNHFQNISANIGGAFQLSKKVLLRTSLASGFRAPSLSELSANGVHHGNNRFEIGNAHLKQERNIELDVNLQYKSTHFLAEIGAYDNSIKNYVYLEPNGEIIEEHFVFSYIQNNAKIKGLEYSVDLHPHPIHWLHLKSSGNLLSGINAKDNSYLPMIPANNFIQEIKGEHKGFKTIKQLFFKITYQITMSQKNIGSFETNTNAYQLYHIGLGSKIKWKKQLCAIGININNLFNTKYYSHLSRLKPYKIYNQGRNISFFFKVPFQIRNKKGERKRFKIPSPQA